MKLSVVVVTWNSGNDMAACLDSLECGHPFETIVVDNASPDGTAAIVEKHTGVRLLKNGSNLGYARANNQGIAGSKGEYVMLLNPDTIVEPGAIDLLVSHLDSHPGHAAVAPKLVDYDRPEAVQHSVRGFPTAANTFWELTGLSRLFPRSRSLGSLRMMWFDYDKPGPVPQPMTSCLLLRRGVLDEMGGLDENLPIFYNDVDLSFRLHLKGMTTWYLPSARVRHRRGASTVRVRPKMIWESHRSRIRYLHKHDRSGLFWLKAVVLVPLSEIVALLRVLAWKLTNFGKKRA